MTAALTLIDPGLGLSLQDFGRHGLQRYGVPPAGALDRDALRLANALVGGAPAQPALEMRALGPTLEAAAERVRLAAVGAQLEMRLSRVGGDGETVGADRSFTLRRGDRLRVGPLRGSSTAYLAVQGGFDVGSIMGSASFFARAPFGGFDGRALAAGDALPLLCDAALDQPDVALPSPYPPAPDRIRVVLGPQEDAFTPAAIETFLSAEWRTSAEIDRMGLRLTGPRLEHAAPDGFNIVSDALISGAIQTPGTGRPIVMLQDRGATGGYPKIATAITADLGALGRLGPGQPLWFEAISVEEGVAAARARRAEIDALIAGIKPLTGGLDLRRLYESNLVTAQVAEAAQIEELE